MNSQPYERIHRVRSENIPGAGASVPVELEYVNPPGVDMFPT